MDISTIINNNPETISMRIAERVKNLRLEMNVTQQVFARRAGVGYDVYRKFENTGEISLRNLLLVAVALDCSDDFDPLFTRKKYESIDELLEIKAVKNRKRATKNG